MAGKFVIDVDLADVFAKPGRQGYLHTLAWGDYVEEIDRTATRIRIRTSKFVTQPDGSIVAQKSEAFIEPTKSSGIKAADVLRPRNQSRVLKVNFVDVQQGDGAVIETHDGKVILVDGGDNQLFARYLAARFPGTSEARPKQVECILVTHGDADHFAGLVEIVKSETNRDPRKRLFIAPKRVYHNGLVKRPAKDAGGAAISETAMLGKTRQVGGRTIITGLVENLLKVPEADMNLPFRKWKDALLHWNKRRKIQFRALQLGDDDAFDFLDVPGLEMSVLGPIPVATNGGTGLPFLGKPPKGPRIGHESLELETDVFKGASASHTINGHSIVFRLSYGGFSFLLAGDLNDESGRKLARMHQSGDINLRSDVFKVPHHGSADFSGALFQMVSPVVSVVSSGDESARKEYIHPRATLMGAIGRFSRVEEPLVFVTELVAFFNVEGWSELTDPKKKPKRGEFFGFSRTAYGIVKTRTDGRRLLVYTDSGKATMKEAYSYELDENGLPVPAAITRA